MPRIQATEKAKLCRGSDRNQSIMTAAPDSTRGGSLLGDVVVDEVRWLLEEVGDLSIVPAGRAVPTIFRLEVAVISPETK